MFSVASPQRSKSGKAPIAGPFCSRACCATWSDSTQQDKNEQDDDDDSQPTTAIVAGPIERTPTESGETAQQRDDQNDQDDCANAHRPAPANDARTGRAG